MADGKRCAAPPIGARTPICSSVEMLDCAIGSKPSDGSRELVLLANMEVTNLPLHGMEHRHPGLTAEVAAAYNQVARVCLDRHHTSPTQFSVQKDNQSVLALVDWGATDQRTRMAWANEIDTTELGAYAMVLAVLELTDGLVAVRRAETGSGADYYVGRPETGGDDLEDCYRLEVSGTDRGSDRIVRGRLLDKMQQAAKGESNLPAMAGVVGFLSKLILLRAVGDK